MEAFQSRLFYRSVSKMKKIIIFLSIFTIGCAMGVKEDRYIPKKIALNGTSLIVNGKMYAHLLLIGQGNSGSYKGIAIHYLSTDRYEWISPSEGWKLENNGELLQDIQQIAEIWDKEPYRRYKKIKGKKAVCCESYGKLEWRGNIKLSDDNKFILFQEASLFGPKDRKYRIRY